MWITHFVRVLAGLLAAVGLPLAAVGLNVVKSHAQTQIEDGATRFLVAVGLAVVVWGIVVFSSFLHHPVVGFLTFFSLAWAVWSAGSAVELEYLGERGRTTSCAVLDVHERVETSYTSNGDGTRTMERYTYYDHKLDCVDRGGVELTLGHELAPKGHRLDLTFAPDNRLTPVPAGDLEKRESRQVTAFLLLALTLFVRVVDFVVVTFSPTASIERPWSRAARARRTTLRRAATPLVRPTAGRSRAAHRRAGRR
ncbi:MAG TPA: hypothetical protein VF821_10600 [Lentzea sp.]